MSNDIKDILYRIKDNIRVVESGNTSEDVLDEIQYDYLELIELIKLFLISEREVYYGYFLMNMQFSVNFYIDSIAGIKLNTFPPVFESNPLLLCGFTLKEIIFIVCHEIEHVILKHPAEMVRNCPDNNQELLYRFNIAADASVNERILSDIENSGIKYMSMPDGSVTSGYISEKYHIRKVLPLENYMYYFNLIKDKEDSENSDRNENDGESGSSGQIITSENAGRLTDHNWETGESAEEAEAVLKEFINRVADTMSDEVKEIIPGRFMSLVNELNAPPKLSWQKILKKYIGTISAYKRSTRSRLNRRQPERYDLSGHLDDKILKIVVAIDTSASVDDDMISDIFNEIFAILSKRKHEITVIECDSKVQRVYRASKKSDIQKKITGRGGTLFTPVIEFINKDKYYRDALLIYFTDGFGEDSIPKPMTYRNIWVIAVEDEYLSVEEPYGAVLYLNGGKSDYE